MSKIIGGQTIKISKEALQRGVVLLDLKEYKRVIKKELEKEYLDKLVKKGLSEYKKGKTIAISSLADLD